MNPSCIADRLHSPASDKAANLPPTISPNQGLPPLPTSFSSSLLVPGATIYECISALLSCHITSCTHRQSTLTVLELIIFQTPSFHPLFYTINLVTQALSAVIFFSTIFSKSGGDIELIVFSTTTYKKS